ncbi:MAG TPA: Mur ligase family protein [Gemmatimonadota bacterium]|nr:Mur ligase family protein [Gemmatimonadota bacterium]
MLTSEPTSATGSALRRLLARREPAGIQFGLERIRALLDGLGNPERAFRAIHVGGTNGKGSVAATAEAVLRGSGRRTGLYTSPHLVRYAERIVVDGEPVGDGPLEAAAGRVLPLAEQVDATFFESTTALAFEVFARSAVEVAVVEVGLGGRLDATNVLDAEVAVITSIDLDHADYLGADPAGIAREKAGIIAPGATVVVGDVSGAARREILAVAAAKGAPVEMFGREFDLPSGGSAGAEGEGSGVRETPEGIEFAYRSGRRPRPLLLRSPLRGAHQAVNVACAVAAVDALTARPAPGSPPSSGLIPERLVAAAVAGVRWPGRFQVERLESGGARVYDIAHNPAAAAKLAGLLTRVLARGELPRPVVLLAAVLGDKDWPAVLGPLLAATDDAVLTDAPSAPPKRRWDLEAAARSMKDAGFDCRTEPDFDRALALSGELAGSGTVLVTGSCYTVGDALRRAGPGS